MRINNNFNVLPFYDSLQKQNSKKWYSFGQHYPLICPNNTILPFQFITDSEVTVSSNIEAVNVHSGKVTNLGVKPSVSKGTQADATYYIVKMVETTISAMPEGLHYLRINTNKGYLYSEEFTFNANHEECIKIEYWNENTLNFNSGEINFDDDFRFILYIPSTIGKPEYEFEEELTKRLGYKFIESQTSNKIYKFNFLAPEYICDAMRLIRLCDYIKLTTKFDTFNALSFAYEPKWQDNGDLAAVDVEFDTDCIIQKLESFNRRLKESFYNALLADIDEPVLFSNDIVAQYYTEFTTTSYINGKLIRQLEAINEADLGSLENLVLPIDNQSDTEQKAKKITLASLKNVLIKLADYVTLSTAQNINGEKNFIGGLKVNGSPIIYDSVNKCWKLQGNLVLTGGITMYADDGTLNLPSIYDGLPIDGTTIYWDTDAAGNRVLKAVGGGGTAESVAWNNITGKPSWIGSSKPTYSYSEIQNTPDLSQYATESWVNQQNYAIKATTLSGYGITDAYTKTNVDDLLKSYVTLGGTPQTITGEKNFTGGLKVNGSPIYYDTEKKYWKFEGDLLVTGGVTMYGSDSSFTPSTIMDAIAVDGTTISKDGGVLKVIGGTGGGVADSVAWANITGKPTWIGSSKPSYSYSEITGAISTTELQNYLTQNSYLNVTSGDNRYLKLSGGTISGTYGALTIHRANENSSLIKFSNTSGVLGYLGFYSSKEPFVFKGTDITTPYKIWHEGNDGHNSGLDADMLDGYHVTHFMSYIKGSGYVQANLLNSELWNVAGGDGYIEYYDNSTWFNSRWGKVLAHYGFDGDLRGNASSATKLQTARSIWGRSFDGTSDISGSLYITNNNAIYIKDTSDNWLNQIEVSSGNAFNIGYSSGGRGYSTLLYGGDITLKVGISRVTSLYIDSNRNGEYNGKFTFKRASQVPLYISNTDSSITDVCARFVVNNAYKASIGTNSGDYLLRYNADLSKSYVIWDSGNDGHNSGLDADTLDGYHSSAFMNFTATGGYVGASMGNETLSKQASGNGYIEFYDSAGGWFNFRLGNILTAGGITMYSMRALKNVVDERGLSLSELSTIKPTRYTWKDGRDNRLHFGGIADDIQQVLPEVVYSTSDGILTMDYGNAAFAVASSLIQPVVDHEKRIAMLEEENKKLIQEIERLKSA